MFLAGAHPNFCRYEWEKDGFGDLLMMALPHHMDIMENEVMALPIVMKNSYQSIKVSISFLQGRVLAE